MSQQILMGKITFIHHEKMYASIEYLQYGKKKAINGNISEKDQLKLKAKKLISKTHVFNINDEVSFIIVPSEKGDKMVADCIEFRFNNAYSNLINKAEIENRFVGYLKKVEDDYFVKETGSYILFPLILSPWELKPHESRINEPVFFKLDNLDKPDHLTASLYKSEFIPAYQTALKNFNNNITIDATIYKITPFGIFLNVIGNQVQAKLPLKKSEPVNENLKIGDIVKVKITYLSALKIIVAPATN